MPPGPTPEKRAEMTSLTFLKLVSQAIPAYQKQHQGKWPQRLDDPDLRKCNENHRRLCSHFYLSSDPAAGVLVCEDPTRWSDGHVCVT